MAKKERLQEFNRGNILSTAKRLFEEGGILGTTMDDIAKGADYSKSTIYTYFKSKEEIYNHVILEHIQILHRMVREALDDNKGFPDGYFAICDALAGFYNRYPLYFESILDEIKLPKGESESVLIQIYDVGEAINGCIEQYLRTCLSERRVHLSISPLQATFTFWAGLSGVIALAHKKEAYINKAMGVTKERFMQDGFELLLQSITEREVAT